LGAAFPGASLSREENMLAWDAPGKPARHEAPGRVLRRAEELARRTQRHRSQPGPTAVGVGLAFAADIDFCRRSGWCRHGCSRGPVGAACAVRLGERPCVHPIAQAPGVERGDPGLVRVSMSSSRTRAKPGSLAWASVGRWPADLREAGASPILGGPLKPSRAPEALLAAPRLRAASTTGSTNSASLRDRVSGPP